jgi:solute carrier family 25 (mitochondrial S-adenosylmethionine transporter), member 26
MLSSSPDPTHKHKHQSTSMQALRMVWQSERGALRNLWSGYTALAARNLPFTALHFPMFESFRERLWRWRGERRAAKRNLRVTDGLDGKAGGDADATASERLQNRVQGAMVRDEGTSYAAMMLETGGVTAASAATSGAIAALVTTPTDVVKTRMMLAAGHRRDGGDGSAQVGKEGAADPRRGKQSGFQVAKEIFQEKGVRGLFRGGALRATWTALGAGIYLGSYEMAKVWLKGRHPDSQTDERSI